MQKGFSLVLVLVVIMVLVVVAGGAFFLGRQTSPVQTVASPSPVPSQQVPVETVNQASPSSFDEIANWKTYDEGKYTLFYPADWKVDIDINTKTNFPDDVIFDSGDFSESPAGFPQKGFKIYLFVGHDQWGDGDDKTLGLVSKVDTKWLGQDAKILVVKYEGDDLVLMTKFNGIDYQLAMSASNDEVREANKELFLKVANTLKIK